MVNEFFICIGAMHYLLYCNDEYGDDVRVIIGYFYICFNSISLSYIAKILIAEFIFATIPIYYADFKEAK